MSSSLRITLLGTGSPSPSLTRHHPAALVQWGDGSQMLVDAGDGVVSQLLAAEVSLRDVEHVAITHLHWDHILGYPAFVWGSWTVGRSALQVIGPAGTVDMHERLVKGFYHDQAEWVIELGYHRPGWAGVEVLDIEAGWSTDIDGCQVEAGLVVHPPMPSLGYRFTYEDRSIVVSGDTARCDELVAFSRNADVLVVDACATPPPVGVSPARRALLDRLHDFHASPQDCVDMAAAANVSTVVLTHHLPGAQPEFDVSGYDGQVVIGNDLDVISAEPLRR